MTSKSWTVNFVFQVAVAVVSGLLLAVILSSHGILQSVWTSFPLPSIVFWLAFVFVLLRIGYWSVGKARNYWFRQQMIGKIVTFVKDWDELWVAYSDNNQRALGALMSRLIVLYTPIGGYVRRAAHVTYTAPFNRSYNPNFDLIGNLLAGNTTTGLTFEDSWRMGRQQLLGALGQLGYEPKSAVTEQDS